MERTRGKLYKAGKREEGFSKALRCAESVATSKGKRDERLAALRGLPSQDLEDDSSVCSSPDSTPRTTSPERANACAVTDKGLSRLEKLRMWREEKKAADRERAKAQKPAFKVSHPAAVATQCQPVAAYATGAATSSVPGIPKVSAAPPPVTKKVACSKGPARSPNIKNKAAVVVERTNVGTVPGASAKARAASGGKLHATATGSGQQQQPAAAGARQHAVPGRQLPMTAAGRQQPAIDRRQQQPPLPDGRQQPTAAGRRQLLAAGDRPPTTAAAKPSTSQAGARALASARPTNGPKAGSTLPSAVATSKASVPTAVAKATGAATSGAAASRLPRAASAGKSAAAVSSAKSSATKPVKAVVSGGHATAMPIYLPLQKQGISETGMVANRDECAMDDGSLISPSDGAETLASADEEPAVRSFAPAYFQFKAPDGLHFPTPPSKRSSLGSKRDGRELVADNGTVRAADMSATVATPLPCAQQTPFVQKSETKCSRSKGATPAREWRGRAALARLAKAATPEEKMDILSRSPLVEMVRRTPKSCQRQSTSSLAVPDYGVGSAACPEEEEPPLFCLPEDDAPMTSGSVVDSAEKLILDEKAREVQHFKDLLVSQTQQLNDLSDKWNHVLASNDERLVDEVQGQIRTTIGQAQLLIAERFDQFSGLVNACELGTGEKKTTTVDLHGFWDMVDIQVQDVLAKFASLDELQERGYVVEEPSATRPRAAQKTAGKGRKRAAAAVAASDPTKEVSDRQSGAAKVQAGKSKFALFREQLQKEQAAAKAAEAALSADNAAGVELEMPDSSASASSSDSLATSQPSVSPSRPRSAVSLRRRSLAVVPTVAQERTASPAFPYVASPLPDLGCSPAISSAVAKPLQSALRDISNDKSIVSDRKVKRARFSEAVSSPAGHSSMYRTTPYRPRKSDLAQPSPRPFEDITSVFSPDMAGDAGTPASNLRRSTRLSTHKLQASGGGDQPTLSPSTSFLVPRRRSSRLFCRSATPIRRSISAIDNADTDEDEQFASRFLVPTGSASAGGRRSRSQAGTPLPSVQQLSLDDCDLSAEVMPEMSPLMELTPPSPMAPQARLGAFPSDVGVGAAASDALKMPPPPRRSLKRHSHARPRASWLIDLY